VEREKDGLWVNYFLADGNRSPYAANLMGSLRHWLNDDPQIQELLKEANAWTGKTSAAAVHSEIPPG